jgi:uncharacterized protein DUF6390
VFGVYPWLGLMRTGVVEQPLHVLDQCRTTPAVVQSVDGDRLRVLAPTLLWDGRNLELGSWAPREVRWRDDGLSLVAAARPGDFVSIHWDFVCDRLTPRSAATLEHVTRMVLAAVNASASTAAALS